MKQFFKQVAAVIVGVFFITAFMGIMTTIMIFSMVSTSESKTPLGKGAVLHLDLNGQISERVTENPFQELLGQQSLQEQGLDQILTAIKVAKDNDNIAGIYIESGVCATDFASLEEIRKALLDFKSSKNSFWPTEKITHKPDIIWQA